MPLFGLAGLAAEAGYGELDLNRLGTAGLARLGHGEQISIKTLLTMAGDAEVIPVIFNDTGGILSYGRGKRLADRGQRLALAARDGGCCFPGCDRPAAWAEVHHIREWAAGAPPTSTTCVWYASFITATSKPPAGPSGWPRTANPNGSHPPGSTPTANREGTPSTTDPTSTSDNPPPPPDRGGRTTVCRLDLGGQGVSAGEPIGVRGTRRRR